MLWWLIGLWVCSPILLPVFWLLGRLHQTLTGSSGSASSTRQSGLAPGD
jgi:hypothetical protein